MPEIILGFTTDEYRRLSEALRLAALGCYDDWMPDDWDEDDIRAFESGCEKLTRYKITP